MKDRLAEEMKKALREKDKVKLETIRSILSAIQYEEIQRGVSSLREAEITPLLLREAKKRKEEMEFAEKAGRSELIEKLKRELSIIEEFLPKQLSREELRDIAAGIKEQNPDVNFGGAMKILKESHAGQYDGKQASEILKEIFN